MKILVTGGCGFVGTNLAHLLLPAGHEVRVLDDESMGDRSALGGLDVEFIKGSVTDPEAVVATVDGMDAVVHLAAVSNDPIGNMYDEVTIDVNGRASIRLAQLAKAAGARSFVPRKARLTWRPVTPRRSGNAIAKWRVVPAFSTRMRPLRGRVFGPRNP